MVYKRISKAPVKKHEILTGNSKAIVAPAVEDILEKQRPKEKLARTVCTFMREDEDFTMMGLDFDYGYINEVEPIGEVQKHDVHWLGAIQTRRIRKDSPFYKDLYPGVPDDELAQRYWCGQASETPSWEYVAKEALVLVPGTELRHKNPKSLNDKVRQVRNRCKG